MNNYKDVLIKYLPEYSVSIIYNWLNSENVQLKINRSRTTKLGDYRPPQRQYTFHRISINYDLNKYHFLITLVHEFAHLRIWMKHKQNVKPHGIEWKTEFKDMMQKFMNEKVIPEDILNILKYYLLNPSSPIVSKKLLVALRKYDGAKDYLTLEEIPDDSVFRIHNGMIFKKLEKLRKRYKCKRLDNNRIYLVSPLMKIIPVEG